MMIYICDWSQEGSLLAKTAYGNSREVGPIEGTREDALRIAGDLLAAGLDVMLCRLQEDLEDLEIGVDDRGFHPRIKLW